MTLPKNKNNLTGMLKKKENAFAIIIFLLFVVAYTYKLDLFPTYRIDEVEYIEPSCHFADSNRLYTVLRGDFIGLNEKLYWQPPTYLLMQGLFFKATGCSLLYSRVFSVIMGLLFLASVYLFTRKYTSSPQIALLTMIISGTAPYFMFLSRFGRMDMTFSFFFYISVALFLLALDVKSRRLLPYSGLFAGLGATSHLNGAAVPLVFFVLFLANYKKVSFKKKEVSLFLLPFLAPFFLWSLYILQDTTIFKEQISYQLSIGTGSTVPSITSILKKEITRWTENYFTPYAVLFLTTMSLSLASKKYRMAFGNVLLAIGSFILYLLVIKNTYWYLVPIIPFMAMIASSYVYGHAGTGLKKMFYPLMLLIVVAFVFVTVHMANSWSGLGNYKQFMNSIRSEIPENETFIANIKEYLFFENNYIPLGVLTFSDNKTTCEILTTRKPRYYITHNLEYSAVIQEQENTILLIRNCGGNISLTKNVNCNCLDGGFKLYSIKWNV